MNKQLQPSAKPESKQLAADIYSVEAGAAERHLGGWGGDSRLIDL